MNSILLGLGLWFLVSVFFSTIVWSALLGPRGKNGN